MSLDGKDGNCPIYNGNIEILKKMRKFRLYFKNLFGKMNEAKNAKTKQTFAKRYSQKFVFFEYSKKFSIFKKNPYLPRNYFFREIFVFFREISNFFFRENFALFSRNRLRRNFPISLETLVWSTKGMNIYFSLDLPKLLSLRTVVKRALSFMHGGSLVIILTIPLHSQFKYTDRDVPSLSFSLYFLSEWKFGNVFRIVYFKYLFFLR